MNTENYNFLLIVVIGSVIYIAYKLAKIEESINKITRKSNINNSIKLKTIEVLLHNNDRLGAIKEYRRETGSSLLEAEKAIKTIEENS